MSTHKVHEQKDTFYFITFTCYEWLPLIEQASIYDYFSTWFSRIHDRGCLINGYVIMPNHLHMICFPKEESKGLNHIIGEAKRFLAYKIIDELGSKKKITILKKLKAGVRPKEKENQKRHQVFRLSFDAKDINYDQLTEVLDYIHHNPVKGKWNLAKDFTLYPYSSAAYYELGDEKPGFLTDYREV